MDNKKTLENELDKNMEKPKRIRDYALDGLLYGSAPVFGIGLFATISSYTPIVPEEIFIPGVGEVPLKLTLQLAGLPVSIVTAISTGIIGAGLNTIRGLAKKTYEKFH